MSLVLFLLGCSRAIDEVDGYDLAEPNDQGSDAPAGELRFDVIPPDTLRDANVAEDADGFVRAGALPQSFRVSPEGQNITLRLEPAADIFGTLTAYQVTPTTLADLPGSTVPVAGAAVSFRHEGSLESANVVTDEHGDFALRLPPGSGFSAVFLPEDGRLPFLATTLDIPAEGLSDLTVDLDVGASIWGAVTSDGKPVPGVAVHAERDGVRGGVVRTDAQGWYNLRVQPGAGYTIVADGREGGLDPSLRSEEIAVDENGLTVPFTYAPFTQTAFHGRIVDPSGNGLANAVAILTSSVLADYREGASYTATVETSDNGNFTTLLVPGTYTMEVLPPSGSELSSARSTDLVVGSDLFELGTLELPGLHAVSGFVADPNGNPVPGAVVTAEEVGFEGRSWSAVTGSDGSYTIRLPQNPIDWTLTPPSDRSDIALTRIGGDQADPTTPVLPFESGVVVSGRVAFAADDGDRPVGLAVVEARDNLGRRWGLALTDADGAFSMRVHVPAD